MDLNNVLYQRVWQVRTAVAINEIAYVLVCE